MFQRDHVIGAILIAALLGLASASRADDAGARKSYAATIQQAQADLDAGRIADARRRLESTDSASRSWEYDYLLARAKAATSGPAPDLIHTIPWPKVEARHGVLDGANRQLVFICRDGSLHIRDLKKISEEPRVVKHNGGAVWCGAFSHDGTAFGSGHENGDVVIWDAKTWKPRQIVPVGAKNAVRELVLAPDGSAFAAEGAAELELWTLSENPAKKVAGVGQRLNFGEGLAMSPRGDTLATGGMFDVAVFDARTGAPKKSMRHASYTMGLEYSPDGKRIASAPRGNVNKILAVFDIEKGQPLFNAGPFGHYVAGLAFTPDGKRIAATGCEHLLRLFDAATGDIVLELKRPECGAKPGISRDGRTLGWSEPDGYKLIDLDTKPNSGP